MTASGTHQPRLLRAMISPLLLLFLLAVTGPSTAQVSIAGNFDKAPKLRVGASISFTCEVTNKDAGLSARMNCPLAKVGTTCFENCNRICADPNLCIEEPRLLRITCSQITSGNRQTYTYYMTGVDAGFAGSWSCKHITVESSPIQLKVYPDPVILSAGFNSSTVIESQTALAICDATGSPGSLAFSWTRADSLTIPHADTLASPTVSQLAVTNARRTDEAVYTCTVENEVGAKAARQASLTVNFPPASVRLTASLASPLQTGVSVTFTCQVEGGKPDPNKRYYRERPGQAREEVPATLTLVPADNAARFYCKAESAGIIGTEIWSSPLTFAVFFPPSGLDLLESPSGAVAAGASKQFACSSTSSSNPPSSALWYSVSPVGLTQQITDSRVTTTQTDGPNAGKQLQSRLDLTTDKSLNSYSYRCILQYESREIARKDVGLQVTFPPSSTELQANPIYGVLENTGLNLICQASSGNPAPRIDWHRVPKDAASPTQNVTVLATSTAEPAENSGTKVTSRLLVTQTGRSNDGAAYSCSIVYGGAPLTALAKSVTLRVFYPPTVSVTVAPDTPREGQRVTLTCHTSGGNPDASSGSFSYVWRQINASGVWTTLSSAAPSLVIPSAASTDNGQYQCSVGSKGGTATGTADVSLIFAPAAWPGTKTAVSALLGQSVALTLRVIANPPPTEVTWYRLGADGSKQTLDSRLTTTSNPANQTYALQIADVTAADYANYVCTVVNPVGSRDFAFGLNRPGPPSTPSGLQVVNSTAVSVQVRWRSEFNGGFDQTFTLQWRPLSSSVWSLANQKTGLRDPGFAQVVQESVTALESQSTYYLRVRAENFYNGAINVSPFTDEVSVTTRQMPVIPDSSLAAQVTSGQVEIQFTPPLSPYYTNVYVKLCSPTCVLRQILESEVRSGRATVLLPDPVASYRFSLVVRDGEVTVYETKTFEARSQAASSTQASVTAAGLSFEIVLGISIGSAVVVAILLAAVIVTAILQCRRSAGGGVEKSLRSTNSSDVTNGSGSPPTGVCGQAVQLAYRSSLSSVPHDGYYCPPPPPPLPPQSHSARGSVVNAGGPDGCGGGFSPAGSRLSGGGQEMPPMFPYYLNYHGNQQHQQMMLATAAAVSRQRLNGTSNGSLNSQSQQYQQQLQYQQQQYQQQHQQQMTPDLVQTETAIGGPAELVRYNSRISLASSRSGFSGPVAHPASSPGPFSGLQSAAAAAPGSAGGSGEAFVFPGGGGARANGGSAANGGGALVDGHHGKFSHALSDSGCGFLSLQPTFVATPLSPHLESNMEAIENYV